MSQQKPNGPYVYQPYGSATHKHHAAVGRLYGVGGIDDFAIVQGLTKTEAEAVCEIITRLREEPS